MKIDTAPPENAIRTANLTLDTFSPVNQNGSFEFDRVIKSAQVLKRTKKRKVSHLRRCYHSIVLTMYIRHGNRFFLFYDRISLASTRTHPKAQNYAISFLYRTSPRSRDKRTQSAKPNMFLASFRQLATSILRRRVRKKRRNGWN
jgi:hypothetical protein